MNTTRSLAAMLAAILLGTLHACGGGGGYDSTPPTTPPTGGIGRNGIAVGPISNFGSVVVNGVRFNTDSATFMVDDAAAAQADLRVGYVIVVNGTIDNNGTTGTANTVTFDDLVTGPVESIDLVSGALLVLGQTVLVGPDTSFDDRFSPASIEGISVGQIVEVTGQIDANDIIVATRIEPKPAGTLLEVHGTVAGLDSGNMRFVLRNLTVDFSTAILDNFPNSQISNGDFVEAKGLSLGGAGELIATKVELESLVPGATNGDRIEIEGFITRFVSASDFDVSGLTVTTNGSTAFTGGSAADLGLNVKVEVEGDINANGLLTATKVDIRKAKAVRATANVDSVNAASNSLVILGITVTVDALTRIEDKSSADVDPLNLTDINAGDYVEVRGGESPVSSGVILATILERNNADTEAILQGFVETVSNPSFSVLGVTITTNGATIFRDANKAVISSADFFSQVGVNSLLKAKGTEVSDTTIAATEVEFEVAL